MESNTHAERENEWQGRTIVDQSGERIGEVEEVYLDLRTGGWDWAVVHADTSGERSQFVPLAGAYIIAAAAVRVGVTKDAVKDAPSVEPGARLAEHEARLLFAHYGRSGMRRAPTIASRSGGESSARTDGKPSSPRNASIVPR